MYPKNQIEGTDMKEPNDTDNEGFVIPKKQENDKQAEEKQRTYR